MRPRSLAIALAVAVCLVPGLAPPARAAGTDDGRIHGEVRTRDGRTLRGAMDWGSGGAFWDQTLSGVYDETLDVGERTEKIEVFGLKLWEWKEKEHLYLSLRVPFGQIERIARVDEETSRLTLRDGAEVGIRRGSGRFDPTDGEIRIETGDGPVEVRWDEVEVVTFAPSASPRPGGPARLFGTVETTEGSFTGFVAWDRDETRLEEVLDGDDDEFAFRDIAEIRQDGARAARVVLHDGREVRLSGTNDVNRSNRGIEIETGGLGRVTVEWESFVSFRLADPPPSPGRATFSGGPILGRVVTVDGAAHAGTIRWGDHERFAWEAIDGEIASGIAVSIPFSALRSVEPLPGGGAEVVLRDGARHRVYGDDTAADARPLEVRGGSGTSRIPWADVARVEFDAGP